MIWISAGLGRELDGAAAAGAIASAGLPAFEQRLALELMEVRIVRLRLDERVDLRRARRAALGER